MLAVRNEYPPCMKCLKFSMEGHDNNNEIYMTPERYLKETILKENIDNAKISKTLG